MINQPPHLGIDIAKDKFDVALLHVRGVHRATFPNNAKGFGRLLRWLECHDSRAAHVCLEATGKYAQSLASFLFGQEFRVSMVNPMTIHFFARTQMSRNKTDAHDALLIAQYSQQQQPRAWQPAPERIQKLQGLVRTREQLIAARVRFELQAQDAPPYVAGIFKKQLALLRRQLTALDQQIDQLIEEDPQLCQPIQLLKSIPGVGRITATTLLAVMPPISQLASGRQLAAFAGVTPQHNDSGTHKGQTRMSKLGHSRLRRTLYLAAVSALRCNPIIQALAARLARRGKKKMVIIGAAKA
jgi:transposase